MTDSYAPTGYFYDKKGNLRLYHLEGTGKAYAPAGYDYTAAGELKKNGQPRWYEVEIKNFEINPDWHYKPFRKKG